MKKSYIIFLVLFIVATVWGAYTIYIEPNIRNKEQTEMVTVLYVDNECFVAKLEGKTCMVSYPNADLVVQVGDQVVITYDSADHRIASSYPQLGGYECESYLLNTKSIVVK